MALARFRTGFCRDLIAALLIAFAMLSGIVQARAATETAASKGFAGAFELCLQSGHAGGLTTPHDHDCDACRLPGLVGAPAVERGQLLERDARRVMVLEPRVTWGATPHLFLPEARGPPEA